MDDTTSFGYWIRRRRKALDLTQDALARRTGCSLGAIRKLEADERRPSLELAASLAQALDVPPEERAAFIKSARGEFASERLPDQAGASPTPPWRPITRPQHNLPIQPTPLIGRTQDVATIIALLHEPATRLLTLTGPGGTGKTRLAQAVASGMLDLFPDGVWFVDLTPVTDPALVISTIARVLGVKETSEASLVESVRSVLRERHALLILDNFEQVVAAASLVTDLLEVAAHLKVLVTSRMVLHVSGEHEFLVPPLALPDLAQHESLEALSQYAAVALFIQRARAVKPDFQVTNENAPAVAEICVRLDGLPLAIELAAARSKLFPPQALLGRLGNRLQMLIGGARNTHARQHTLRHMIDWSYNLLNGGEQTLFARLAVFVGGWTIDAAEVVCSRGDDLRDNVVELLQSLLDKSLVQAEAGVDGEMRCGMLETIREYARECLEAGGQADIVRRQHAVYYLSLAEDAAPGLYGSEQMAWGARLEHEQDNLRAALRWFIDQGAAEESLRLTGALWRFWAFCGHVPEGRTRLDEALKLRGGSARSRALALLGATWLAHLHYDNDVAFVLQAQCVALSREADDRWGLAFALAFPAFADGGLFPDSAESVALFESLSEPWGLAIACVVRCFRATLQGDPEARAHGEEGVRRFRESGDLWFLTIVLGLVSDLASKLGDAAWHALLVEEHLALVRRLGDRVGIANSLHSFAGAARWLGEYERAAALYDECTALYEELGVRLGLAHVLHGRAMVAYHLGDDQRARALIERCLPLFREAEYWRGIGWCFEGMAGVATRSGASGAARAARLLGAGEIIAHFSHFEGPAQAEYEGIAAVARARLGDAAWEAAWAEGQVMTLEQAIAYALETNPE